MRNMEDIIDAEYMSLAKEQKIGIYNTGCKL